MQKTCTVTIDTANYTFPEAVFTPGFSGSSGTIATVTEKCNTPYRASIRSDNNLRLATGTVGENIPYTLHYDTFTSTAQDFANFVDVFNEPKTTAADRTRPISVTYSIPADQSSGTYTDVITFKVTGRRSYAPPQSKTPASALRRCSTSHSRARCAAASGQGLAMSMPDVIFSFGWSLAARFSW
jgi:hypothetical protein